MRAFTDEVGMVSFSGLTLAWPKGRLGSELSGILATTGLEPGESGRRLWSEADGGKLRFLELKPVDVVTVVERGVADVGMVGKDIMLEYPSETVEIMDLETGGCRLSLAGPASTWCTRDDDWKARLPSLTGGRAVRVATKYPRLTTRLFSELGVDAVVVGLSGSVELAPAMGLSDIICDLVATGQTLTANGLVEISTLMPITARLVANPGSLYLKSGPIREFCSDLRAAGLGGGPGAC